MQKNGFRPTGQLLRLTLGLGMGLALGCGTSTQEEEIARKSIEPTLSVNQTVLAEQPEIDDTLYIPYYKTAELPQLELIPLESPAITQAELMRELWGETNPSNPDGFRAKRPSRPNHPELSRKPEAEPPYWFSELNPSDHPTTPAPQPTWSPFLPDRSLPEELHGEIVAFLRTYPALNTGEFQIRQIGRKRIYQVSYFTTKYSDHQPTLLLALETERFQVEQADGQWQIRSPTVALPEVAVKSVVTQDDK